MILLELSSTSHIWVVLSFKIAREGEGIEGKGKKGERKGKNQALSLNLPQYSLQLLFKTLSDASCARQEWLFLHRKHPYYSVRNALSFNETFSANNHYDK
jgi:hypothetical protein